MFGDDIIDLGSQIERSSDTQSGDEDSLVKEIISRKVSLTKHTFKRNLACLKKRLDFSDY